MGNKKSKLSSQQHEQQESDDGRVKVSRVKDLSSESPRKSSRSEVGI